MKWAGVVVGTVALVACGELIGTGSSDPAQPGSPAQPTADAAAEGGTEIHTGSSIPDASPLADVAVDTCVAKKVALTASADTGLVDCGSISYGHDDFVNIGVNSGKGVGIFRFTATTTDKTALINAKSIRSASLYLTANVKCSACGGGLASEAGTMEAHVARSDWVESTAAGTYYGADRCRRTDGSNAKGWGAADVKWAVGVTEISAPTDFDTFSNSTPIDNGALDATIPIRPEDITARGFPASGMTSFVVSMPAGGRMIVATHDPPAPDPAVLTITYCE